MSQDWTIEWVGDKTKPWRHQQHGPMIDYYIGLTGWDKTVKVTQKPETPAPQVGQNIYGAVSVEIVTPKNGGESFEVHKFKKEKRPDGLAQVNGAQALAGFPGPATPSSSSQPGPEFWAARDRRISRAGLMQAVVAGGLADTREGLAEYVAQVNKITDALAASLDEHTPSPNNTTTNGSNPDQVAESLDTGKVAEAEANRLIEQTKTLDPSRWLLELVAAGAVDITKPEEAIRHLTPAQASAFGARLDDLAEESEAPQVDALTEDPFASVALDAD